MRLSSCNHDCKLCRHSCQGCLDCMAANGAVTAARDAYQQILPRLRACPTALGLLPPLVLHATPWPAPLLPSLPAPDVSVSAGLSACLLTSSATPAAFPPLMSPLVGPRPLCRRIVEQSTELYTCSRTARDSGEGQEQGTERRQRVCFSTIGIPCTPDTTPSLNLVLTPSAPHFFESAFSK